MEIASYKKNRKLFYKTPHLSHLVVKQEIFTINAENISFGRLASQISTLLQNKQSTTFSFHIPLKPKVIIKDLDKILWTGKKEKEKKWMKHTEWTGNYRYIVFDRSNRRLIENI